MDKLAFHLAWRYVCKRRIAWLAVVTCMLSVGIPIAVIGVIQGFVDVSERQIHGAESDLVAKTYNHYGLPIDPAQETVLCAHKDVEAVAPYIKSYSVITPRYLNDRRDSRFNTGCQIEGVDWKKEQDIQRLSVELLHKRPGLDLSAPMLSVEERGSGFLTPSWRAYNALHAMNALAPLGGMPLPIDIKQPPIGLILGHELIYSHGMDTFWPGQLVSLTIPNNKGGILGKVVAEVSDTIGTGYLEFDRTMAVMPLNHAQHLTDMDRAEPEITGYRMKLKAGADADTVRNELLDDDKYRIWWQSYTIRTWEEMGSINMVKTFEVQRNIMILVMLLVQAQCIFIVYAVFSTLVSEKRKDIGILLGIGAKRKQIMNTFVIASLMVCSIGGILGWLGSWLFLFILNPVSDFFDISLFPPDVIYTPEAPISYDYRIALFFLVIMIVIGYISALIPAYKASRIMPLESIRDGQ